MNDEKSIERSAVKASRSSGSTEQLSADELMSDFQGSSFARLLTFTVIAHILIIGVFSMGYIKAQLFGQNVAAMSKDDRIKLAVQELTTAIHKIAKDNDVDLQDIKTRLTGEAKTHVLPANSTDTPTNPTPASAPDASPTTDTPPQTAPQPDAPPKAPASEIEKKLQETKQAPDEPSLGGSGGQDDPFGTTAP